MYCTTRVWPRRHDRARSPRYPPRTLSSIVLRHENLVRYGNCSASKFERMLEHYNEQLPTPSSLYLAAKGEVRSRLLCPGSRKPGLFSLLLILLLLIHLEPAMRALIPFPSREAPTRPFAEHRGEPSILFYTFFVFFLSILFFYFFFLI